MPSFQPEGGLLLALVRAGFDLAALSCFGALLFRAWVAPRALARAEPGVQQRVDRLLLALSRWSILSASVLLPAWLVLQTADMADAAGVGGALRAAWPVLAGTLFGHVLLLQAAALAATAVLLAGRARWPATVLAGLVLVLEVGHGHAFAEADGPDANLLAGALHLLSSGAWLGGLLPLLLVVRVAPARTGAAAARWFSPLGKWCVALLAGSAVVQFIELVGGLPGLVGTAYGWTVAAKILLFGALLAFACLNRYGYAPRLLGPDPDRAKRTLVRAIAVQTVFGVAAVLAASWLGSLPPGAHEQPVWPFPVRPSLTVLSDPDLRNEVLEGAVELGAGLLIVLLGVALWRRRWLALGLAAAGVLVGSASASHLDLLLVEAYPTSYFRSPTAFAATSIAHGAALFPGNCASCHGADGKGDGPLAAKLSVPPADLTAPHLWEHADGELFWWLTHGMDEPEGSVVMPGFAGRLDEDDRWALVDFIRARNAGTAFEETGSFPAPVQAPSFTMTCPGRGNVTTEDLRGSVLHVVAAPPGGGPVPPAPDSGAGGSPAPIVTVLLGQALPDDPAACATADPAVWDAYAVVSGLPRDHLAGTQFLVDPAGWVRAVQRPGETVRWSDPALLLADVRAICGHPLAAPQGGHVHH